MTAFNRRINTGKTFKQEDKEDLSNLKNVLDNVNITMEEFELLLRMKRTR